MKTTRTQKFSEPVLRGRLVTVLLFLAPIFTSAQGSNLLERNPFFPEGYSPQSADAKPQPTQHSQPVAQEFELRGIAEIDGKLWYSIFMKKTGKGIWIEEGTTDTESGIAAQAYDADSQTADIGYNNRTARIVFRDPTPNPPATAQPPAGGAQLPPGIQLPPGVNAENPQQANARRRVIPRRRVILPEASQ